jgi:hypothetical protein
MYMEILQVQVHAAWTWTCIIDKDIQHDHGMHHRQWTCTMNMDTYYNWPAHKTLIMQKVVILCSWHRNYELLQYNESSSLLLATVPESSINSCTSWFIYNLQKYVNIS